MNVLLAKCLNLGLSKMVEATNTYDYLQLSRLSRWHIQSDDINRTLTMVIDAQANLHMFNHYWPQPLLTVIPDAFHYRQPVVIRYGIWRSAGDVIFGQTAYCPSK